MASTASPQGFLPKNLIGGQPFAGSTRMLPIASAYGTSIFYGDAVKLINTGFIIKDTGTTTMAPVGIFLGCQYTDSTYGFTTRQMWTASTVPANSESAIAFVADDPDLVMQIQASAALTQAALGLNAAVVQGAGSTITGDSRVSLSASSVADTNTLPLRIVGFVGGSPYGENCIVPTDSFPEVLVKWNFGMHQYERALGAQAS